METYFDGIVIIRFLLERGIAAIYLIAFISALNQFPALLGATGLLPAPAFIKQTTFKSVPTIFHLYYSDIFATILCWTGVVISGIILTGILASAPWYLYIAGWLVMWFIYLSIVNVGRTFYSFGWESMLLEAGFFAGFLGPEKYMPSLIPVIILRWMLFRVEFGAGLIKLRHDPCWRDYTCLYYHYETQPMPGPLSWYFHHMPKFIHRFGVAFSHFVQLLVPFGLFAPQPVAHYAAILIILHQLWLVFCGNYSWLNWLTIILGFSALSDTMLSSVINFSTAEMGERPFAFELILFLILAVTIVLSWKPLLNFFSKEQLMNYCYNPYHLVCVYGAFGSVTKERFEIVIEGTLDDVPDNNANWQQYEFKGKPGDPAKTPRQFAPYHLRLDWSMWFLPFSVIVQNNSIHYASTKEWFIQLCNKLLQADPKIMSLLQTVPFRKEKPKFIRSLFYHYKFTDKDEKKLTGNIWKRSLIGEYLQPMSANDLKRIVRRSVG